MRCAQWGPVAGVVAGTRRALRVTGAPRFSDAGELQSCSFSNSSTPGGWVEGAAAIQPWSADDLWCSRDDVPRSASAAMPEAVSPDEQMGERGAVTPNPSRAGPLRQRAGRTASGTRGQRASWAEGWRGARVWCPSRSTARCSGSAPCSASQQPSPLSPSRAAASRRRRTLWMKQAGLEGAWVARRQQYHRRSHINDGKSPG
jgi:hypothetical protein